MTACPTAVSPQTPEKNYTPSHLLIQWHITDRCNLRCSHCYQEKADKNELAFKDLLALLEQFKCFLQHVKSSHGNAFRSGHITLTGGEPFVREDFIDLLEILAAQRQHFSFAILTNGSLLHTKIIQQINRLQPAFIQVSLEGTQPTHDRIRGDGNFAQTISAIRELVRHRICTLISFTAHRDNYREFPTVAQLGRKLGVFRVWADRLIPLGNAAGWQDKILTPAETREFFELMLQARSPNWRYPFRRTDIAMHRALQFLVGGGKPYHCTAGDSLIAVQPNGDLYPCRRMPIHVGNLLETPLPDLYYQSELLRSLRDRDRMSEVCRQCFYSQLCQGGLRCLAYAVYADPFQADPGCWRAAHPSNLPVSSLSLNQTAICRVKS